MRQDTLKALYELHSWLGVTLGLLLYVVSFSGVVALFAAELSPWARGELAAPAPAPEAAVDAAVARAVAELRTADAAPGQGFTVILPTRWDPAVTVHYMAGTPPAPRSIRVNAAGLPAPDSVPGPQDLLTRLHTDLLLPQPAGRYAVGTLGVLMLVSVATGVLLHRKPVAELFTLRLRRSRRLLWTDLHKSAGLWGLPFHAVMALTGAVLGFAGVAVLAAALTAYDGDAGAALAGIGAAEPALTGRPAEPLPPSALLQRAVAALPGMRPEVAVAAGYGDAGGVLQVYGNRPGALVYYPSVTVRAATGEIADVVDWSQEPAGRRLYAMVTPLHYASYGGLALKLVYAALGAGSCLLVVSGLQVWLSRPAPSPSGGRRALPLLAAGVVHGLPLATAAAFWLHGPLRLAGQAGDDVAFAAFLAAAAVAMAWPWLRGAERSAVEMQRLTGWLLVTLPLFTLATVERQPHALTEGAAPLLAAELTALLLGILLLHRTRRQASAG